MSGGYIAPGLAYRAQLELPEAPNLGELVAAAGGYWDIDWAECDRATANYQLARREALDRDRWANNNFVSASSGGSALTETASETANGDNLMPTAQDYFPSKYLRASDLGGKPKIVTIDSVTEDLFENEGRKEKKPIVNFAEPDVKGLVCNKTNFLTIASICGDDTNDWRGKKIVIYPELVAFRGKASEAVRVRSLPKPAAPAPPDLDDTIPF